MTETAPNAGAKTKAAHTPGPWKAVAAFAGGIADGASFYSIDAGRAHVAEVLRGRGQDIGLHQLRANARLIAAAPLLLDACKQAVELFEDDEGIAQVLLAAIAAAEGRA